MRPFYFVVALPLAASGCATTLPPDVIASHQSESAHLSVRPVGYASPFAGYTHRVPVDPKPWRLQNEAQSPEGDAS
ncbi:hypothetical protein [Rhizobium subbaraonis]|uniref:hypothetical protein n=1 Tax=Rhizobium subbaraonis TaxID=908946 RepID=UPI000BE40828|nr:hypothetical protein [Rhizobium subbaraonis]